MTTKHLFRQRIYLNTGTNHKTVLYFNFILEYGITNQRMKFSDLNVAILLGENSFNSAVGSFDRWLKEENNSKKEFDDFEMKIPSPKIFDEVMRSIEQKSYVPTRKYTRYQVKNEKLVIKLI